MISQTTIDKINENADIVEVIGDFVNLKRSGKEYKGLSPFNDERTPSFSVNPQKEIWKCFSSGKGGNSSISFLREYQGWSFPEAIKYLGDKFDIIIDEVDKIEYQVKKNKTIVHPVRKEKATSYIPVNFFKDSLSNYEDNSLVQFLISLFDQQTATDLISKYYIGTSNRWNGANIFWQIDTKGNIRTGKIMKYNTDSGKRDKKCNDTVKSLLERKGILKDFNLVQCFFGEHLLKDRTKTVAIVESEKTALIASVFFPDFIWLACGGLTQLTKDRCKVLQGRNVILFPDIQAYDKWNEKATELCRFMTIKVSGYLERNASKEQFESKDDIADFLIHHSNNRVLCNTEDISKKNKSFFDPAFSTLSTPDRIKELGNIPQNTIKPKQNTREEKTYNEKEHLDQYARAREGNNQNADIIHAQEDKDFSSVNTHIKQNIIVTGLNKTVLSDNITRYKPIVEII